MKQNQPSASKELTAAEQKAALDKDKQQFAGSRATDPEKADGKTAETASTTTGTSTTTTSAKTTATTAKTTAASAAAAQAAAAARLAEQKARHVQQQFLDTITKSNNCLYLVRQLRIRVLRLHSMILKHQSLRITIRRNPNVLVDAEKLSKEIRETYDRLENLTRRLPHDVPLTEPMKLFKQVYTIDENPTEHANIPLMMEKLVDAGNWNEGEYQMYYYLNEFLRAPKRRPSALRLRPAVFPDTIPPSGPHTLFKAALRGLRRDIAHRQLGIYPKILATAATSTVLEFKFGTGPDKTEKTIVFTMKFLLAESHGNLDYINVIAPHEEWHYEDIITRKTIDFTRPSKYLVYRKMTAHANYLLQQNFTTFRWTSNSLVQVIMLFGRMRDLLEARCKNCGKVMKDFLPPLIFDIRRPKDNTVHEACR